MTAGVSFDWSAKKSHIAGVGWPPVTRGPGAAIEALARKLDETQWLSRAEIEREQFAQLRILAAHFQEKSPAFRARLEAANLRAEELDSPGALRRLPRLGRREVQDPGGVADEGLPKGHLPVHVNRTSGSTGEPVAIRRTVVNALFWRAFSLRELSWHEKRFDLRLSTIRATNAEYKTLPDWGPPVSLLFASGMAQTIPITADIAQQVRWLAKFSPQVLIVYPNVLDAIVRYCRQNGVALPDLKLIRSVSETLSPRIREEAAAFFGARVVENYSSQELGVIAVQCADSDCYHTMDEGLIVEVIGDGGRACAPGEAGRLVITDLQNYATPMIRYDIGDYAEAGPPCSCGRGLHTLKRVLGRERNLILMPDGTRHWPLVGFSRFREVAPVVQYQFIQDSRDSIEVKLVVERALAASEEAALGAIIAEALGYPFRLRFAYFKDALPRGAGGKFEEFVCRVQ